MAEALVFGMSCDNRPVDSSHALGETAVALAEVTSQRLSSYPG